MLFFKVNRLLRKIFRLVKKEFSGYGNYTLNEIFDEPESFIFGELEIDMVPFGHRGKKVLLNISAYHAGELVLVAKTGSIFCKTITFKEGDWEKELMGLVA